MKARLTVIKQLKIVITPPVYKWKNKLPFPIIPPLPNENKQKRYKTKPLDIFSSQDYKVFHKRQLAYFCVLLGNSSLDINSSNKHWLLLYHVYKRLLSKEREILYSARFKIYAEHKN